LETYNCEQLIGIMTEEQFGLLEQNLKETEENVKRLNVKTFAKLDHAFHLLICKFTGNQEIYRVILNYQNHLLRITLRHLKNDPLSNASIFEGTCRYLRTFEKRKLPCRFFNERAFAGSEKDLVYIMSWQIVKR
jgi:DNA-binding GntR family transcriptional regulator